MKNAPTPDQGSPRGPALRTENVPSVRPESTPRAEEGPRLPPAWREALVLFDRDLRRRGASERTRRAYGVDLGQLAGWAGAQGLTPQDVDYKVLRRYAAVLSNRRAAQTTVARKLAATRQFFRSLDRKSTR